MIKIRPHHINCIYFFKGYGYSEIYVKEMKNIITYLEKNQNEEFEFILECDNICKACPRKNGNFCIDENKINELDTKTIKIYNLNINKKYTFKEIKNKFYKNFNFIKCKQICNNCEWRKIGLCSDNVNNTFSKLK